MKFVNINLEKFKQSLSEFRLRELSLYDEFYGGLAEQGEGTYTVRDENGNELTFIVRNFYFNIGENFIGGVRSDVDWGKILKSEENK